jgi:hypothetical protein
LEVKVSQQGYIPIINRSNLPGFYSMILHHQAAIILN